MDSMDDTTGARSAQEAQTAHDLIARYWAGHAARDWAARDAALAELAGAIRATFAFQRTSPDLRAIYEGTFAGEWLWFRVPDREGDLERRLEAAFPALRNGGYSMVDLLASQIRAGV